MVKNLPTSAGDIRDMGLGKKKRKKRHGFDPWVWKIPRRRVWQTTPVFLPGESHGERSLAGCSPKGHKESDTTEHSTVSRPRMVPPSPDPCPQPGWTLSHSLGTLFPTVLRKCLLFGLMTGFADLTVIAEPNGEEGTGFS